MILLKINELYLMANSPFNPGDQVLEWNGEPLSGKKDPEIVHIMSKTSGEVELVIKW